MKLRNKKTGVIGFTPGFCVCKDDKIKWYEKISDVVDEWEDYEEPPKEYWYIDTCKGWKICRTEKIFGITDKEIGNYFETKEEAEKAVEKLKAWKLLRDECDIKFDGIIRDNEKRLKAVKLNYDRHQVTVDRMRECVDALHLLFGGEDEK